MTEDKLLILKWVKVNIICGITADLCYGLAMAVPMPDLMTNIVFWAFGPLLIAGAPGLYLFVREHKNSIALQVSTIFMVCAGFAMTLMSVTQRAVIATFSANRPDSADANAMAAWRMGFESGNAIQLGLDIVWDIFILTSCILVSIAIYSHPKFGKIIAILGGAIGLAGLTLNFLSFPTPPGAAGSFDVGPLCGLWFLAVMIMLIKNFKWFKVELLAKA